MAKSRTQKATVISDVAELFRNMKSAVFTSVSGYTMTDADTLRAKGREAGVTFTLVKKTLLQRALKDAGIELDKKTLEGSILSAVGTSDEIAAAKLVSDFAKGRDTIKVVGGFLDHAYVGPEKIAALAQLGSKQQVLASVVGTINAPISSFVRVLDAVRSSKEQVAA